MRLAYLICVLVACGGDDAPPIDIDDDLSCEADPDPHCDHPIDRLLVPKLRAIGSGPRDASADEVCRRMAIDLLGRVPTDAERATCRGQTFAEMAKTFLAAPELERTQRRAWGELAKYESLIIWGEDIADLDALVGSLYRGDIGYPEFVRRYVVHPGFYGLHPDDSWTSNVFSIFLGRPARQDELDAARPLLIPWVAKAYAGGEVFWNHYQGALANGATEEAATSFGDTLAYNGAKVEWGMNLCRCTPDLLNAGCFSTVFGELVSFQPYCVNPAPRAPENFHRLAPRTPSSDDLCPDGLTRRPECADRERGQAAITFAEFIEWQQLPAAEATQLDGVGNALLARDELWEAEVDRELRKLLGWWQATFKHPESDLPEVRALLAGMLRDGASVRDLIALIVTSQLYVQPAAAPDLDRGVIDLPQWATGPSKLLAGESWLASAAIAVGETAGVCDFRWGQGGEYEPEWIDPRLVETRPGSIDPKLPPAPPHGYSVRAIQRLGGCTGDAKRPEISNVGLAFSQAAIARELCATATSVTPPNWSGDLHEAAAFLVERAWSRSADPAELDLLVAEMATCVAAGPSTGCADANVAARWLCRRLIDSVPFATY
jgi:hypothetical protein